MQKSKMRQMPLAPSGRPCKYVCMFVCFMYVCIYSMFVFAVLCMHLQYTMYMHERLNV